MINYYLITKPGIVLGNLITVGAGFLLASKGNIDIFLFLATLLGLSLIMASSCVFNNDINREIDKKMERTKERALAKGTISRKLALLYATLLGISGAIILYKYTNPIALFIAVIGFFVYVVVYSFWKSRTIYGTAIGSIAGAVPPVVGYCAVSGRLDLCALILFAILVLWQMPHFFSIAIYHLDDYVKGDIPVLPTKKGMLRTKIHMVTYIIFFIIATATLTFQGYTGNAFFVLTTIVGILWLALCIKGFYSSDDRLWAKQMFRFSLITIISLSLMIPFDLI